MRRWLFFIFLLLTAPLHINAQLDEIRAIQQQMPLIKDSSLYVDALNRLGILFHFKSVDTCFLYAQKAKAIADRLQYPKGQAGALRNLGLVHLLKRNTYLALKYLNKCLPIYKTLDDSVDECFVLMNIGNTLATEGRLSECFAYLTSAYNLGEKMGNDSIQSLVIVNLVNDSTLPKDSITRLLDKATAIAEHYHDYRMRVIITEARAEQMQKAGNRQQALVLTEEALAMAKDQQVEYEIIDEGIQLGDILLASTDTAKAIMHYKDALKTAEVNGYKASVAKAAQRLYTYYSQRKDLANETVYAAVLIDCYKSYQQDLKQQGIGYLDYTLQEQELEELRNNNRMTNYVVTILSTLSATVMALLFFMFRSYQARKKYIELLQERNQQAGARNTELQYKNEFNNRLISLLAHDFRQPLTAVKGMMALLKEPGALTNEEISFLATRIENSSDTSLEIFDNILHWIKKQVSGFVYEPESLQLNKLVADAAKSLLYTTDKFEVTVINNIPAETIIFADKEMLQFINRNLIHNAAKFSPPKSKVYVGAVKTDTETVISVKDQGKGISREKLDYLFTIFSKTQYASDKEKGSGVALVICKDFLERMHGRIWAESELGKGTTFFYALPLGDRA